MRIGKVALVLGLSVMLASAALAQEQRQRGQRQGGGGGGFGGPLFLLGQKSVQEDLKLSEEQVKKVTELQEKQREAFQGLRDLSQEERRAKMQEMNQANEKAVAGILNAQQQKRVKQIGYQLNPGRALSQKEVAEALKLTDEQKDKLKTIQEEAGKEMRELFQGGGDREEAAKKMREIQKSSQEKMMGVLTDEQKTKWKELAGTPFKGEIQRPGGRRGGQGSR
jgi:Spy/CpxP family protein refolding chaperone